MSEMLRLQANSVLRRATDLEIRVDSDNRVLIGRGLEAFDGGPHALMVLAEFARPRPLAEALGRLETQADSVEDWRDLTATVVRLCEAGVLQDLEGSNPVPKNPPLGYDAPRTHIKMLDDRLRTERFLAAVRAVVRPGDVVVEIGTGTGILAVAAAQAGARRVYAIEASGMAESAQRVFAANGVADRITLVRGWSTRVELPERSDVLISEMIGHLVLGESLLELTGDALRRLLKPGARLVPGALRVFGLPVTVPSSVLGEQTFAHSTLDRWRSWYGVDLGPLAETAGADRRRGRQHCWVDPYRVRSWPALSPPLLLADLDLGRIERPMVDRTVAATAALAGTIDGIVEYFEADLSPGIVLSTRPETVAESNHWRSPVWIARRPLSVLPGDRFEVRYFYNAASGPNGAVIAAEGVGRP